MANYGYKKDPALGIEDKVVALMTEVQSIQNSHRVHDRKDGKAFSEPMPAEFVWREVAAKIFDKKVHKDDAYGFSIDAGKVEDLTFTAGYDPGKTYILWLEQDDIVNMAPIDMRMVAKILKEEKDQAIKDRINAAATNADRIEVVASVRGEKIIEAMQKIADAAANSVSFGGKKGKDAEALPIKVHYTKPGKIGFEMDAEATSRNIIPEVEKVVRSKARNYAGDYDKFFKGKEDKQKRALDAVLEAAKEAGDIIQPDFAKAATKPYSIHIEAKDTFPILDKKSGALIGAFANGYIEGVQMVAPDGSRGERVSMPIQLFVNFAPAGQSMVLNAQKGGAYFADSTGGKTSTDEGISYKLYEDENTSSEAKKKHAELDKLVLDGRVARFIFTQNDGMRKGNFRIESVMDVGERGGESLISQRYNFWVSKNCDVAISGLPLLIRKSLCNVAALNGAGRVEVSDGFPSEFLNIVREDAAAGKDVNKDAPVPEAEGKSGSKKNDAHPPRKEENRFADIVSQFPLSELSGIEHREIGDEAVVPSSESAISKSGNLRKVS